MLKRYFCKSHVTGTPESIGSIRGVAGAARMTPPVFLAVDVSNIVARAYHATAAGKEGQSVIGLARHRLKTMLKTLLRETEPVRLIGALDSGKCFRHDLFPEYKAHRGEKPAEFRQLLDEAPDLLRKEFGMELYHSPGFEADDVLASLADQCLGTGVRFVIASNDKDLFALAHKGPDGSGTYLLHYDANSYCALGPSEVETKLGVPPHRVALLKAIQGDNSDNIPGIVGLGPVAAKRLANAYPSMSSIFANLERLQTSDRTKLQAAGLEEALRQETLVTLRYDTPVIRA
ncbi:5'-3' exonuclease [Deinococcus alpinitundrae]|uniref:5'-3' exonuclease n=1 Tax=Deinococcus alpinitundrae TaxID=468913 RepID=UPI00137A8317|nr:5'-3' exonuclease H3TH domain-containing protein [Deinococcus alpinitundrae]